MKLEALRAKFKELKKRAKELREIKTEDFTDEQRTELSGIVDEMERVTADIETEERAQRLFDSDEDCGTAGAGDINGGNDIDVGDQPVYRGGGAYALGSQLRDIMLCSNPSASGNARTQARSRLEQCEKRTQHLIAENAKKEGRAAGTGMIQGVGSDGGFLLQGETSIELMTHGFNNSEVLKRCANRTLTDSDFVEVVGIDESSRADGSRGGGIRVYTTAELEAMTESKPKLSKVRIEPKKLTGLFYASDEILKNVTFLGQEIRQLFGEEFAFKGQDLVIRGTGSGEPLGIMNADCLVTVAKESAQPADTIQTQNVLKMDARVHNDASPALVWLVNRDCKPQLATLVITTGDGTTLLYKTYQNQGVRAAELNGAPCVTIEQCETVGTKGDILLCDFSQYITANKGDIQEATSIHVKFEYNQTAFRFVYYFDGQPRWASALTPYKGTNTTSPFIALADRD